MNQEITLESLFEKDADPKILAAAKRLLENNGFVVADVREFREPRLDDPFPFPNAPPGELPPVVPRWQRVAILLAIPAGIVVTVFLKVMYPQ
jgi:hypothetical protein